MQIIITRDPETRLLAGKITPKNKVLEDFFVTEIQNDTALIKELRKRIERGEPSGITGNAYFLQYDTAGIRIKPLFDCKDMDAEISITDFLLLLTKWEAALRSPHS